MTDDSNDRAKYGIHGGRAAVDRVKQTLTDDDDTEGDDE